VYGSVGDGESPFEQAVAQRLIDKGWVVHHQIGVSSFRIDLGIVHPDAPGIYLAGIECDGTTYHRAATARDRDKLREQILRRLGWTILRVWSPDWWFNAADAAAKLHQSLLDELARSREKMAGQQQNGAAPSDSAEDRQQASEDRSADANATAPAMPLAKAVAAPHGDRQATSTQSVYRVCDPAEATAAIDPAKFYDSDYNGILLDMIAYVIAAEGPIHETVLVQRLTRAHRFQRAGRRIRDRVRQLAAHHFDHHEEDVGTFFWPRCISAADWHQFRPPHTSRDYRGVEIICVPELLALARDLRTQGLSDIPTAMARQIGMSRLTASARKRLEDVLQTLV
jgi:very-short-patch-repair endonuclease